MRYIVREKFLHLGEDSVITNDAGQPIYEVDSKILSLQTQSLFSTPGFNGAPKWPMRIFHRGTVPNRPYRDRKGL